MLLHLFGEIEIYSLMSFIAVLFCGQCPLPPCEIKCIFEFRNFKFTLFSKYTINDLAMQILLAFHWRSSFSKVAFHNIGILAMSFDSHCAVAIAFLALLPLFIIPIIFFLSSPQCENLAIFLQLRFYVKSILVSLESKIWILFTKFQTYQNWFDIKSRWQKNFHTITLWPYSHTSIL